MIKSIKKKLVKLGLEWPEQSPEALANYKPVRRSGNLIYTSGNGSMKDGKPLHIGKVGKDVTLEEAYEAARITAVNLLSMVYAEVGSLENVKVIKLLGFVNCTADFFDQPSVIDGASDVLVEILGENGKHARSAIGVYALPLNIPVEIEMIVEITS